MHRALMGLMLLVALGLGIFWAVSLSESLSSPWESTNDRLVSCCEEHPDWDLTLCQLIAERKISERQVIAHPDWPWFTIAEGQVRTGMTDEMVIASWGKPAYTNEDGFLGRDKEWACGGYCLGFVDGILTDIEEAPLWGATNIIAKHESNEIAANVLFQGRSIMIVGYVYTVSENSLDGLYIELRGGEFLDNVRCYFSNVYRQELATLYKGQKVVIKGIGLGKDLFTVDFVSCRLFWKRG